MILQSIAGFEWIIGVGIVFGLALVFTVLLEKGLPVFLAFLSFFDTFAVWVGLLPLWTLVLCLIILTVLIYLELQKKKGE